MPSKRIHIFGSEYGSAGSEFVHYVRQHYSKMTVWGRMVCSDLCNSWCYCLASQHQSVSKSISINQCQSASSSISINQRLSESSSINQHYASISIIQWSMCYLSLSIKKKIYVYWHKFSKLYIYWHKYSKSDEDKICCIEDQKWCIIT